MMVRRRCAVLGATGLVGQRLQQRLINHPWFELAAVVGSRESAGKWLSQLPWRLDEERPESPDIKVIYGGDMNLISQLMKQKIQFIFSALPELSPRRWKSHWHWLVSRYSQTPPTIVVKMVSR